MKETIYIFKVDAQYRIALPISARAIYQFDKDVYIKLQVINSKKYIQISGKEIDFVHTMSKLDSKGRFTLPKEVREKFGIVAGDILESFEVELDSKNRSLLLIKEI